MSTRRLLAALALAVGTATVGGDVAAAPSDSAGCDFDGNGYADLAVGSPTGDVGGISGAGSVHVVYGTATGLSATGDQIWHRAVPDIDGGLWSSARFGSAIACGDFDADGRDDLAVGAPGDRVGGHARAGSVHVIYGTASGLSAAGDQIWHRGVADVNGSPGADDGFGRAVAAGDFDGDGHDDLAIGVPGNQIGRRTEAGSVHVVYGTANGLSATGDQIWHRDRGGINAPARGGQEFGSVVAAGDFDGDGHDDVAIGVPEHRIDAKSGAGSVHVIYGTDDGLARFGDQIWHRDRGGINGATAADAEFGSAIATGDFDGDGHDDLAAGVHRDSIDGQMGAGSVHVIYGTEDGLARFGDQIWHRGRGYVDGTPRGGERFGSAVATGDFDGDGFADLAAGVPRDKVSGAQRAGSVNVLYGTAGGLTAADDHVWNQDKPGIEDAAEVYDRFGSALASGDHDGDGYDDLDVGVPWESIDGALSVGAVEVVHGGAPGLVATDDQLWMRGVAGLSGTPEPGDLLGYSIG